MVKKHLLKRSDVMYCGARLSQNPALKVLNCSQDERNVKAVATIPDVCETCVKQWKISLLERPSTVKESVSKVLRAPSRTEGATDKYRGGQNYGRISRQD